jgi:hypothetical protein
MRPIGLLAAAAFVLPTPCPAAQDRDPDAGVAGRRTLPPGWHARADKNKPLDDAMIVRKGDGMHVTLGPAVVLWRDAHRASGNYRVVATFTQNANPRHPEGYGLFIGGSHLTDTQNRYTYFLVRGDGKFLVKRRITADSTALVTNGWTDSDAIATADAAGKATNELGILVRKGKVSFQVNGKEVFSAKAVDLDAQGMVGYRVNHTLDVHLGALGIRRL